MPQEHVWVECVDDSNKISQAEIQVITNLKEIKALKINKIDCPLLTELNIDLNQEALCFYIPQLDFHVLGEGPVQLRD